MIPVMFYSAIAATVLGNYIRRKLHLTYGWGIVCRLVTGLVLLIVFHR